MAYQRVLVATDFSDNAALAARWGLKLADADGAVRVLSVLSFPEPPPYLDRARRDELLAIAAAQREDARASLRAWAVRAGVPAPDAAVREGLPSREIAREAVDFGADLVVLGARGAGRVERLLVGSTTRSVLRHVACDALVVRGEAPGAPRVSRIVVATDFYGPSKAAGRRALRISEETGADLVAYHAIDPGLWAGVAHGRTPDGVPGVDHEWLERTTGEMLHRFNEETMRGKAKETLGHGRAPVDLARHAEAVGADLVVVGTHGAGFLARAVLGSVAEGVVERAPCSVLVARP